MPTSARSTSPASLNAHATSHQLSHTPLMICAQEIEGRRARMNSLGEQAIRNEYAGPASVGTTVLKASHMLLDQIENEEPGIDPDRNGRGGSNLHVPLDIPLVEPPTHSPDIRTTQRTL